METGQYVGFMSGLQIVLVSANPLRAETLERQLREAGHQVVTFRDAARAGLALQDPAVGAVVVDTELAGLDRIALARSLTPEVPELPPEPLEAVERRHIAATLLHTKGNKRRAAMLLGIARSTLIQKVRRYNITIAGRNSA